MCVCVCLGFDSIEIKKEKIFSCVLLVVPFLLLHHIIYMCIHHHTFASLDRMHHSILCRVLYRIEFDIYMYSNIIIAERSIQQKRIILFDHFYSYVRSKRIVVLFYSIYFLFVWSTPATGTLIIMMDKKKSVK